MRVMHTTPPVDRRTTPHSTLTPEQRSQRARIAAASRWAKSDGSTGTQAARSAFLARFEAEVDPEGTLPAEERERRAESAKRAHFQRMAYKRHRPAAKVAALPAVDAEARQRAARNQSAVDRRQGVPATAEAGVPVVYFMRRGDRIKIGTTTDLRRRLQSFQQTLEDVVATLPGGPELERIWHQRFKHLRCHDAAGREWFRCTGELLDAIYSETGADVPA